MLGVEVDVVGDFNIRACQGEALAVAVYITCANLAVNVGFAVAVGFVFALTGVSTNAATCTCAKASANTLVAALVDYRRKLSTR